MKWMSSNVQGVTRPVVLAVDDLVVNGAKVALPKVVLHENEVSPEAQALLDAYARRVHRPSEHGLVTASGAVMPDGVKAPLRRAFSYSAPLFLKVTLPPEGKPDAASGRAVIASTTFALLLGLDGLRLTESLEYDARVVENADARKLEITNYGAGARTGMSEITFDGAGLVASLRRRDGPDAAAPTSDVEFRFVWEKSGTGNRVHSAELISGPADKEARKRYTLTYSTINGVDVVTSYIVTVLEAGSPEKVFSYRIEDLVVNGKKVDPPPAGGTPK
jgi:hypothetical protein